MLTIMLCTVFGLSHGIVTASFGPREIYKYAFSMIFGISFGAVVGLLTAIIICTLVPTRDVVYGPGKLVAMQSSEGVTGTFVWGFGNIGNRTSYNFMQRMEDGSMVPASVPADGLVHLIEDPELKNVGFWSTTMREADPTSRLYDWAIGASNRTTIVRQEFRVPVGTVVQQFSIK